MTYEKHRHIAHLSRQLSEFLMSAVLCAEEIRSESHSDLETHNGNGRSRKPAIGPANGSPRPILNASTLCVYWEGRSLHLGNTLSFKVLERLARRPNQYVTYSELLREAWNNRVLEKATIRSQVRDLRRKFRDGGMANLASAIRGHNEHYVLVL